MFPPASTTPNLDDLLRAAHATLDRSTALEHSVNADEAAHPAHFASDEGLPQSALGTFLEGVGVPDAEHIPDLWQGPEYAAEHPVDSLHLLLDADRQARAADAAKAENAPSGSEYLGYEAAAHLPFIGPGAANAGESFGSGDFVGGTAKTAALLGPLLAGKLAGGVDLGDENPRTFMHPPEPEPPAPIGKPERYAPNIGAPMAPGDAATSHIPYGTDTPSVSADGFDPYMPNTGAARVDPEAAAYPSAMAPKPSPLGSMLSPEPTAPEPTAPFPGPESEAPGAPAPDSPLTRLFKPHVTAADAAANLGSSGSLLGDMLDEPHTDAEIAQIEADRGSPMSDLERAAYKRRRQGTILDDKRLENEWNGLRAEYRENAAKAGTPPPPSDPGGPAGDFTWDMSDFADQPAGSVVKNMTLDADGSTIEAPPPAAPDRAGHFTLPQVDVPDDTYRAIAKSLGVQPVDVPSGTPDAPAAGGAPSSIPAIDKFFAEYGTPHPDTVDTPPAAEESSALKNLLSGTEGSVNVDALRKPVDWNHAVDVAHDVQVGNLVSGPSSVAKIGVSNLASLLQQGILKSAREGSMASLKALGSEVVHNPGQIASDFKEAILHGAPSQRLEMNSPEPNILQKIARTVTRPIGAMDAVFRNVAGRSGMSPEEAAAVVQQQTPQTAFAQRAVSLQRTPLGRLIAPIMRSPMNLVERGFAEPAQAFDRLRTGTSVAPGEDIAKIALATAAGAAGYTLSDKIDELSPWLRPLALAAAGSYEAPAAVAYAIGHAPTSGARAALQALFRAVPLAEGLNPDPSSWASRAIPAIVRQANPDYWTHTTREKHGLGETIESKLPGLAQLLNKKRTRATAHRAPQARAAR